MKQPTKTLTSAQRKANARNQLFRQIYGFALSKFVDEAVRFNAVTYEELDLLNQIRLRLTQLKLNQFDNSKKVGLNPRRRCKFCGGIARWKADYYGIDSLLCNKCKQEAEEDNEIHKQHNLPIIKFEKINPYD